ncbi:hypothetical protein PYW08_010235 [Mythimna loreyi]|uniref:Uncharacterized protein n=1 Tax=Mythimna loreyi TaxID=667449 RepID=A0ACC2Q6C8_9NEOP|nr:hypothetical protein PYW08_010235 [Mythimna loreyi]
MCRCLVKFTVFSVNLISLIIGLLVIGGGVFLVFQLQKLKDVINQLAFNIDLDFVPYTIIGLGAAIVLISFFGCCGSVTDTKCLLVTYAVCMALLAGAKIVITILLFVMLPNLRSSVEGTVNGMFLSDDAAQNVTFHLIEAQFKCCGTFGPDAYVNDYNLTSPTCCPLGNGTSIDDLPIDNLPIDNLPIDDLPVNLTTKNLQSENLPINPSNLPSNIPSNIDLAGIDLGGIDLGGIDLGDLDLDQLANLTMCKKEDAYEIGCTTLIGGAVQSIGKSFGIALICIIVFEVLALAFTIYLIRTLKPRGGKVIDNRPMYYY